jgi:tetratricopeptide (TPR) repeat protein
MPNPHRIRLSAVRIAAGFLVAASMLMAQPKPKSQKELDAIVAMQSAQDPDARIKAANELLTKFADTEFKPWAHYFIASSYREKNDHTNTIIWAERVIESDGKSAFGGHARVMIAAALATTTKEFDFDKDEKLGRADKLAKEAVEILTAAPKFNPGIPDDQWELIKKDYISEAYAALGLSASVRKNWNEAIAQFRKSLESAANGDPVVMVRLSGAYNSAGKYDEAIAAADQVIAAQGIHPSIQQVAKSEKEKAMKAKSAK